MAKSAAAAVVPPCRVRLTVAVTLTRPGPELPPGPTASAAALTPRLGPHTGGVTVGGPAVQGHANVHHFTVSNECIFQNERSSCNLKYLLVVMGRGAEARDR